MEWSPRDVVDISWALGKFSFLFYLLLAIPTLLALANSDAFTEQELEQGRRMTMTANTANTNTRPSRHNSMKRALGKFFKLKIFLVETIYYRCFMCFIDIMIILA